MAAQTRQWSIRLIDNSKAISTVKAIDARVSLSLVFFFPNLEQIVLHKISSSVISIYTDEELYNIHRVPILTSCHQD